MEGPPRRSDGCDPDVTAAPRTLAALNSRFLHDGKGLILINRENTRGRTVPLRTIIAAIAMFTGIILLGFGYFQAKPVMIYAGVVVTLAGVMTEAVIGIMGRAKRQRGG